MGIDGVIPGVAYTLLNSKLLSDQLFSVYLVKLLLDSGLNNSITPQLFSMAQSNPQWNQIINQRNNNVFGIGMNNEKTNNKKQSINRSGGIGFSSIGSTPQAMTSSMLANQTQLPQSNIVESEGVKKAFIKLMGSKETNEQSSQIQEIIEHTQGIEQKKRKSRFSSVSNEEIITNQTTLPGFIRSTNTQESTLSSSNISKSTFLPQSQSQSQSQPTQTTQNQTITSKRSRWGYST